jgi:hypothetical protein
MELSKIKLVILDFDGVLTNNKVLLNEDGEEFVSCSRAEAVEPKNYKSKLFSRASKENS